MDKLTRGSFMHCTRGSTAACAIGITLLLRAVAVFSQTGVKLYEHVEETMTNSTSFGNPFTDTELRLDVTAPSGRKLGSEFTWYGFHDGDGSGGQDGDVWKFRILFDQPGEWSVEAGFFEPGTSTSNGPSETFTYTVSATAVSGEHGHVRIDSRNRMRFAFDDGTPWVPISVHSSGLLERDNAADAKKWIDEHAAAGVDALGVDFSADPTQLPGEKRDIHFLGNNGKRSTTPENLDYTRFDVATWHLNEKVIDHAQAKGVRLFIWFGISGINGQYGSYGPMDNSGSTLGPKQELFIRYFLSRWGSCTAWWHWTVDSEWEEAGKRELQINYAKALRSQNPWKILVSNHSLGDWTLGGTDDGWGLATLQRRIDDSNGSALNQGKGVIEGNDDHGIPVFNEEGVWNLGVKRTRVSTLCHLFAGGYSHFATWVRPAGGSFPEVTSSWQADWGSLTRAHSEAVPVLGRCARFFNREDIDINAGTPAHNLVGISGSGGALCLADKATSYYVWANEGGTPTLDLSGESGTFHVRRYDCSDLPASGGGTELDNISGGDMRSLGSCPESGFGNDYLFVVTKEGTVNRNHATARPRASGNKLLSRIDPHHLRVTCVGSYRLEVYDMHGDMVTVLRETGPATIRMPEKLSAGSYLVRLRAGNGSLQGKRMRFVTY